MPEKQFSVDDARAVDEFIDALMRDPKTANPASLSPELADFIRTLLRAEHVTIAHDVQARVWRKAYIAAQVQRLQQPTVTSPARGTLMTTNPMTLTRRSVSLTNNLTLLAAASAIVIFAAGMVALSSMKPPPNSTAYASSNQAATPSLIPTEALTATPTSSGVIAQPIELTATAIISEATTTAAAQQTANAEIGQMDSTLVPSATFTPMPFEPTIVPLQPATTPTVIPPSAAVAPYIPPEAFDSAERVDVNSTITGQLTPAQPYLAYEVEIQEDGMIDVIGLTADFPINLSYQYVENAGGGGGGGGGGSDSLIPRAELVAFVKKGSLVRIVVSSLSEQNGSFKLSFYFDQGKVLDTLHESVSSSFDATSTQFRYYLFTGNPGAQIDVTASALDGLDLSLVLMEVSSTGGGAAFSIGKTITGCTTPTMSIFCMDDNSGKGSDPELTNVVIRSNTLYAVLVRPVTQGTGLFTLTMAEHAPLAIDQTAMTINLNSQLRRNAVVFTGKAGQAYTLKATVNSGMQGMQITVLQNGYVLLTGQVGDTAFEQQVTAIADGLVVVIAEYAVGEQDDVAPASIEFSLSSPQ